jgi:hypothetical protein
MIIRERLVTLRHCRNTMTQYRFRTPHRSGKWYASLAQAQRFANAIGAGFLDATGGFVAYRGTVLELREKV